MNDNGSFAKTGSEETQAKLKEKACFAEYKGGANVSDVLSPTFGVDFPLFVRTDGDAGRNLLLAAVSSGGSSAEAR